MSPENGTVNAPSSETSLDIEVRRTPDPGVSIVAAARSWALAFEAKQQRPTISEGAELALYDAVADATQLKRAEVALYQAILAAELIAK